MSIEAAVGLITLANFIFAVVHYSVLRNDLKREIESVRQDSKEAHTLILNRLDKMDERFDKMDERLDRIEKNPTKLDPM